MYPLAWFQLIPGSYQCACCGQRTLESDDFYDICPICKWEDDPVQRDDPDYAGGANCLSLNQSRDLFSFGRCFRSFNGIGRINILAFD